MKLSSWSAIASLALGFLMVTAPDTQAQDRPVALKFSHWVPPTHPMHAAAVSWAESIDKA
jgi:TRAP-type transport system periplasmic protein